MCTASHHKSQISVSFVAQQNMQNSEWMNNLAAIAYFIQRQAAVNDFFQGRMFWGLDFILNIACCVH